MTLLYLALEFAKIGLFALGGGPATLPFLSDLAEKYPWYNAADLANFVAISESTPGPLGVNMATYAGYHASGIIGGIVATLSLVLPSIIVIIIVAKFLKSFSENKIVKGAFYGIRPAVAALITAAIIGIFEISLFTQSENGMAVNIPLTILCVITFALMQLKWLKKLHPVFWLAAAAVVGIIFQL